jgi:hypothetical protein
MKIVAGCTLPNDADMYAEKIVLKQQIIFL